MVLGEALHRSAVRRGQATTSRGDERIHKDSDHMASERPPWQDLTKAPAALVIEGAAVWKRVLQASPSEQPRRCLPHLGH